MTPIVSKRRLQHFCWGLGLVLLAACGSGTDENDVGRGSGSPAGGDPGAAVDVRLLSDVDRLEVPEGRLAVFRIKLSAVPSRDLTITAARIGGDADVEVKSEESLLLSASAWDVYRTVVVGASPDDDADDDSAVIRVSGAGVSPLELAVRVIDDDALVGGQPSVELADSVVAVAEGRTGQLRARLTAPPEGPIFVRAMVPDQSPVQPLAGGQLEFTADNWDLFQTLQLAVAEDTDVCNGQVELRLEGSGVAARQVPVTIVDAQRPMGGGSILCGRIGVSESAVMDSDVNDPDAPYSANDTLRQAQPIPNPSTVGGYVSAAASAAAGRASVEGDPVDFYAVALAAGQTITLHTAERAPVDLDLYLHNGAGEVVDAAVDVGGSESLSAPAAGSYLLEVRALGLADGAAVDSESNYILTLGQAVPVAGGLRLSDEFVPGEVIVHLDDTPAGARTLVSAPLPSALTIKAGSGSRTKLFRVEAAAAVARALTTPADGRRFAAPDLAEKLQTLLMVKTLRQRGDVSAADPNYLLQPLRTPNDSLYNLQWHYPLINLPLAWDVVTGSGEVTVGVIDTGVLTQHGDLAGQIVGGYDFISSVSNALDGDGIDADATDPGDQGPGGSTFHGTHVSGTIAALTDNGEGVAGVAWGAKVMPLRVFGKFGGSDYDIQQAVRYAAGLPNDSGTVPARPVDVLNLSFGGARASQTAQETFSEARAAGVVLVAAAGNSADTNPSYPAAYDGVIGVSAVDLDRNLARYSSFGPAVDVAAPGGDASRDGNGDGTLDGILSTGGSDRSGLIEFRYPLYEGTSMAVPHVAGVIALMKSVNPALTPQDVDDLLLSGALTTDLGAQGRDDQFGYGLIDAFKAVNAAAGTGGTTPEPAPSLQVLPLTLNFGTGLDSATVSLANAGGGSLTVEAPVVDQPWLSVRPVQVDDGGVGSYEVRVDRQGLEQGVYSAVVTFPSNGGAGSVSVVMQVGAVAARDSAGLLRVFLLNPDTHDVAAQTIATRGSAGAYNFSFARIPPGVYHVFASSDSNNDGRLCDPGEACGAFNTLDQPSFITVGSTDVPALDFNTGFVLNFGAAAAARSR